MDQGIATVGRCAIWKQSSSTASGKCIYTWQ